VPVRPDAEDYDDYGMRMFEFVTGLAKYEDRQASAVIDDLIGSAGRNGASSAAPARTGQEEAS
jgi:hypothetical protein